MIYKNTRWLYLMSKYTGRELDSLKENQDAWLALHSKGYLVYSPICESHNIEEYRQQLEHESPNNLLVNSIDYVARDLALIKSWLVPEPICGAEEQGYNRYSIFHDGCIGCKFVEDPIDEYHCSTCGLLKWKQPKVVGVVLPSAYHYKCSVCHHQFNTFDSYEVDPHAFICGDEASTCDLVWDSKGAKAEYDFMKAHHILCISLETALTIPFANWGDHAL